MAVSSLNGAAGGADLAMQALKSERFSLYQGGDLTAAGQPPAEAKWVVPRSCSVGHAAIREIAERYTPHGQIVETDSFLATRCRSGSKAISRC